MADLFPRDARGAIALLEELKHKDRDMSVCRYPTCNEPRQESSGTGRPSAYCSHSDHTAVTNHRVRRQLRALATGIKESEKQEPGEVQVVSLRTSVLTRMGQLQEDMQRYVETLENLTDPEISAARIAESQQIAQAERSLRLAAESAVAAAEQVAQDEREAAEMAIYQMEEAEARWQRQQVEADQRLQDMQAQMQLQQAEANQRLQEAQAESERQLAKQEAQAQVTLTQVQAALVQAQEEVKQAQARTREVELLAQAQAKGAEERLAEAKETIAREREEIKRLREELAATIADARAGREADRAEVRTNLERERGEAKERLEQERAEVKRLREDLAQAQARADKVAQQNSELQRQIVKVIEAKAEQ